MCVDECVTWARVRNLKWLAWTHHTHTHTRAFVCSVHCLCVCGPTKKAIDALRKENPCRRRRLWWWCALEHCARTVPFLVTLERLRGVHTCTHKHTHAYAHTHTGARNSVRLCAHSSFVSRSRSGCNDSEKSKRVSTKYISENLFESSHTHTRTLESNMRDWDAPSPSRLYINVLYMHTDAYAYNVSDCTIRRSTRRGPVCCR